jgi:hypothetical protein
MNVATFLNGLIGLLVLIVVPYVVGRIANTIMDGDDDDDKWGIGIIICLLLAAGFTVVYVIGVLMELLKIALI